MVNVDGLKRTPFFDKHQEHEGKIVDFSGWALPVQYSGIIDEHQAVRQKAGLFDVTHMGELRLVGPEAEEAVNYLVTNDVSKSPIGRVIYSPMCYPHGGTVDDLLIYKFGQQDFLLVVNGANKEKDLQWVAENTADFDVQLIDESDETGLLALQGPKAEEILSPLVDTDLSQMKYYWFEDGIELAGHQVMVSRTGYTGEAGFEVYCETNDGADIWDAIMQKGEDFGLVPAGLGARDTLRFEAGLCLYGQELGEDINPLAAGLSFFVKLGKEDFIGKEALQEVKNQGPSRRLIGFEMLDRGIPRTGYPIYEPGGEDQAGEVTSGSYAPTLEKNLGMGYVPPHLTEPGTELRIEVRNRKLEAVVVEFPFYKREG